MRRPRRPMVSRAHEMASPGPDRRVRRGERGRRTLLTDVDRRLLHAERLLHVEAIARRIRADARRGNELRDVVLRFARQARQDSEEVRVGARGLARHALECARNRALARVIRRGGEIPRAESAVKVR